MKKELKIVTIGGGSSYTPELIEGFINRYDKLPIKELWLTDIEQGREKLEVISKLAQRMADKANIPMKIIPALDRRKALKDADFVTTQIRVGGLEARIKDERIPISFGLIGQETNGAGGMFKALRTIPVILNIVKDIQELCPDAWMINFSNPAGMVSEAIVRHTNFKKSVGLCNVPVIMANGIAQLLRADLSRIRLEIQGLNHHIFATDVFLDGQSVFERVIREYIKNNKSTEVNTFKQIEYSADLITGLNAIPCPYLNYYFFTKEQLEKQLKEYEKGETRGEVAKKLEAELLELYKDANLAEKPKQLEQRGGALYSAAACNLISSIYNNTCDIQYVNIKNNGTITNLPGDSVVEAACVITKDGPKPIALGEIKPQINGTIQMIKSFERLTVEAAVKGDRCAAIAALNINPLITSDKLANQVFDALLQAHREYLPQF